MPRIAINAVQDADPDILTILAGISSPRSTGIRCGVEDRTRQVCIMLFPFYDWLLVVTWDRKVGTESASQAARPDLTFESRARVVLRGSVNNRLNRPARRVARLG